MLPPWERIISWDSAFRKRCVLSAFVTSASFSAFTVAEGGLANRAAGMNCSDFGSRMVMIIVLKLAEALK